ncbi:MAG: SHOCT domain-containing protein [Alphaproteobacteria bacterium]|nr:SHOCT domain-containing protein [Alphaproteobacteria bacterium]
MKVYEDKCVLTTKVTIGSVLTSNATDGEKTIYYSDVLGVQFKRANLTIGYLQFETASSSMNNKSSNFWNENSFTFEEGLNPEMEIVAEHIKKKVEETKRQKNAPVVVTNQVSSADELKKFKELLDMGVITQEEFDAKKKQLLGL